MLSPYLLSNNIRVIDNDGWIRVRVCPSMPWVPFGSQLLSILLELYTEFLYVQGLDKNSGMTKYVSKLE